MFGFSLRSRRPASARTAKERLQILLAHERSNAASSDMLPLLQRDILEVVRRHMHVNEDAVDIKLDRGKDMSSLEINIELPAPTRGRDR